MKKSFSMFCALITTFIWGTAFIAQDTGMDNIGPLTFNSSRFFVGFLTILPLAILIEKNQNHEDIKSLLSGLSLIGDFLDKTILKPNNLSQPLSRLQFINTLK